MGSVIAKLDNSVFDMLTDQAPRILIDGICSLEETKLVNTLSPDFVRVSKVNTHEITTDEITTDKTTAHETAADKATARKIMTDKATAHEAATQFIKSSQNIVIAPGIKVISSVDDIPLFSSAAELRTLSIDTSKDASKLPSLIRAKRPDLLVITFANHDEAALNSLKKLVRSTRSVYQDFVD